MKNILPASITCFILTLAAGAFGQNATPTPVFKPKPTPEFKVSVIEEVVLVPVPTATPRPQLTNNKKIESNPLDELEKLLSDAENEGKPTVYTPPSGKPELKQRPAWTHLTDGVEGETKDVSVYYRNAERKYGGDVEVWLQFLYAKPKLVVKKRAAYHIGFATLHCDDKRISIESGVWYDTGGKTISTPFASLNNEYRKPIVPDSVGETIWEHFCRD